MKMEEKENERLISAGMVAMKQPVDEEEEDGWQEKMKFQMMVIHCVATQKRFHVTTT